MADIKTRDVRRGSIKTLDRAASSMNRLKDETIRSKASEIRGRQNGDESESQYAPDASEHAAGAAAAYAARSGAELLIRSRDKPVKTTSEDAAVREQMQRAFREQGIKTIHARKDRMKMADEEILRTAEEDRLTGRIRRYSAVRNEKILKQSKAVLSGSRIKLQKHDDPMKKRRKEYAVKRITEKNAKRGGLFRFIPGSKSYQFGKFSVKTGMTIKGATEGSHALLSTVTISSSVIVGLIVIMILFGAALTFNEDGSYINGTGDETIVEVARGELGNHGGAKFWKWYGFKSRVDWCAIFCSWCADQCGYLRSGVLPKFAIVGDGARWFKSRHRWSGRGYKPKPGDFIFFDYGNDGVLDHVGIVESCDGKTVTTIEGNSSDRCRRNVYSVGNLSIAGYGLMVRTGGNKAKLIALWATQLAYPNNTKEARYHGGKPTAAYAAALNRAYPKRSGWGKPSRDGASCDVFVGTCIVDSGVDKDFPRGYRDQAKRLAKRTDLYECVISTTSRNVKESELKDGDICTWEKSSGTVHIWIYAGGKARQAAHDKWYPRTTALGGNVRISGRRVIRVYRVRE